MIALKEFQQWFLINKRNENNDENNGITMQIFNLSSTKYKLKVPVNITLEKYEDEVLALLPELTLCGEGLSEQEAIEDLKVDILDLLDDLGDMPETDLGTVPKLWKQSLDLMVEECQ